MAIPHFYRNTKEIASKEGVLVDEGSLWISQGNTMLLVDDDQYVSYDSYPMDPDFTLEDN
jgi:hypothetical protein